VTIKNPHHTHQKKSREKVQKRAIFPCCDGGREESKGGGERGERKREEKKRILNTINVESESNLDSR